MVNKNASTFCRVCGLDQDENPWGEDNASPTFDICACCGTEFGYHDFTLEKETSGWPKEQNGGDLKSYLLIGPVKNK